MRPESVRITLTLSGDQASAGVRALGLTGGTSWTTVFCEDVTDGIGPCTPLLDAGVVLRARALEGAPSGCSSVTLRPCRWSQLSEDFFTNTAAGPDGHVLRIEAEWSGSRRELVASSTSPWSDGRLAAVSSGELPVAELFGEQQRRFLERCAPARVTLSAVTPLAAATASRWGPRGVEAGGVHLSVRVVRWEVGDLDLVQLSVRSSVESAGKDQAALARLLADRGLVADPEADATRRLLGRLVGRPAGGGRTVGPGGDGYDLAGIASFSATI